MISKLSIDKGRKWVWQIICLGFHLQRRPRQAITMKVLQLRKKMIKNAVKPKDQLKPGGEKVNQIIKKSDARGRTIILYSKKKVVSNESKRKVEYANINR